MPGRNQHMPLTSYDMTPIISPSSQIKKPEQRQSTTRAGQTQNLADLIAKVYSPHAIKDESPKPFVNQFQPTHQQ